MQNEQLIPYLLSLGYEHVRVLPDNRIIGTMELLFTTGLFVGLNQTGYMHRYCYPDCSEAISDAHEWTGESLPKGNWIKLKGHSEYGDYLNPLYFKIKDAEA